ncbi:MULTISPECIES: isoprenylcysteine carboxyl methyltransferase family protein [unclassified Bradyrhizobium]|uniref:isoprenylcysteine carboxyl methyltransferase family protein n=1 Tax=Bradyrhizobium TaxID=374 RepID=UPI0028E7CD64|nr:MULTISPECIES: isoprenylcysteine carboxylmethyltransferase family protein [unclassified Bradyrhizobium]
MIIAFIVAAFAYRFAMLGVSIRNEKRLRADGATEYGASVSRWLAIAHVAFYLAATAEGLVRDAPLDAVSIIGFVIYLFGAVMLLVVSQLLGRLWTVKLMLARDHALVTHPLFRIVRHPNYFLNILPELIGYALTLHAYLTLVAGLIIYAVPLTLRIRQEEDHAGAICGLLSGASRSASSPRGPQLSPSPTLDARARVR